MEITYCEFTSKLSRSSLEDDFFYIWTYIDKVSYIRTKVIY